MADEQANQDTPQDPQPPQEPQASPAQGGADAPPASDANSEAMLAAARGAIDQLGDLNALMAEAMAEQATIDAQKKPDAVPGAQATKVDASGAKPLWLEKFDGELTPGQASALDLLGEVQLNVKIELGRTRMLVEDVLRLSEGAVVELDKLAGDPVDVYVNDRHVARGEVLVLNDNFCVRINEILAPSTEAGERGVA